jgi:hypothetical protein
MPDHTWGRPSLSYDDAWCAWFVTWCIRGLGFGRKTYAAEMRAFGPEYSVPQVGDIAVWGDDHTGIVSKIVSGTVYVIDGNGAHEQPSDLGKRKVQERKIWGSPTYTRPDYDGSSSSWIVSDLTEDEDMHIVYVVQEGQESNSANVYMLLPDGTYRIITRTEFYLRRKNPYDPEGDKKRINGVPVATINTLVANMTKLPDSLPAY